MVEASEKGKEDASSGNLQAAAGFVRDYLRRPFSFYLISLLLIAIVPPFIFSFVILQRNLDAQREEVTSLLRASTGSVTRIVEREVDGMNGCFPSLLRVLRPALVQVRSDLKRSLSSAAAKRAAARDVPSRAACGRRKALAESPNRSEW